jgi:uncharacterized protein (DUF1697 family)
VNRQILLLRGINLGARRRVAMASLRELLEGAGFTAVRTYVQSGNVVLSSSLSSDQLVRESSRLIEERFGFSVPVVARTRDELAAVVARDPFGELIDDAKRYQVTFLASELEPAVIERVVSLPGEAERVEVIGRELYTWHPGGIARSPLWAKLSSERFLGVAGTARNWTTVTTLLSMADDG